MWTTFDGSHYVIFPMFVWIVESCDHCEWLYPSCDFNASIVARIVQWNTYPYHRWDIFELHLRGSHYGMPWDVHVEWELYQQHHPTNIFQPQRVLGDQLRRVPLLSIRDVSNPQIIFVVTCPTQICLRYHPWLLGWGDKKLERTPTQTCVRSWQLLRNYRV